jgi:hypothetical protein
MFASIQNYRLFFHHSNTIVYNLGINFNSEFFFTAMITVNFITNQLLLNTKITLFQGRSRIGTGFAMVRQLAGHRDRLSFYKFT